MPPAGRSPNKTGDVVGTIGGACTSSANTYGWPDVNGAILKCVANVWTLVTQTAGAAGSTGYVQFNNANALAGDSNLFWDNTNKRLGIGTTAPAATLQVGTRTATASNVSTITSLNGASTGGIAYPLTVSNTATTTLSNETQITFTDCSTCSATGAIGNVVTNASNAASDLRFLAYTGTALNEMMRIQGSTGYVGIGTSAPSAALDVTGLIHANGAASGISAQDRGDASYTASNGHLWEWYSTSNIFRLWSGSDLLYVTAGGSVGIGVSPSYPLDVTGDIRTSTCLHYASSTLGACSSDAAIKRDIAPYVLGLDAVTGLKPVTYAYNGLGGNPDDGKRMIGLIAQDVEKTVPQLVGTRRVKLHPGDKTDTEIRTVDYGSLTYMLINAVKELKLRFDGDHGELAKLKADNDQLVTRISAEDDSLKAANDNIAALRARLDALGPQ